jgi:hypothetical protein
MDRKKIEDIIKQRLEVQKIQNERYLERYRIKYLYTDVLKEMQLEFQQEIVEINNILNKYYGALIVSLHSGRSGIHSLDKNNRIDDNLIVLIERKDKRIMEQYYNFINNHSFFEVGFEHKRGMSSDKGYYFTSKYQFFGGSFNILEKNENEFDIDVEDKELIKEFLRQSFSEFLEAFFQRSEAAEKIIVQP